MNLAILNVNSKVVTMSSREIAELTGKDLSHIHRDTRAMLDELAGSDDPDLDHVREEKDARGYTTCFHLLKGLTITLMTGYSVKMRHAIVRRWQELEAAPAFTLPDFTNPASAARAWAIQYETSQTLTIERDHAIATKAQIGNKKVATAMATASARSREASKLKDLLGFNTRNATVIAVEGASGKKFGKQDWRPLKAWCQGNGASSITVPCVRYGKAQAWPAGAWGAVYGVDLVELFGGAA